MAVVARGTSCGGVFGGVCGGYGGVATGKIGGTKDGCSKEDDSQLSILELILAVFRKSMAACVDDRIEDSKAKLKVNQMEIGWPTDVRHLTHVTFDRFHGFLGLPVEFEVEVPSRVPSAKL